MAKVLLHHYMPGRAQLGLKTIQSSLPSPLVHEWESIVNKAGIHSHPSASKDIVCLIQREETWIFEHIPEPSKIKPLWDAIKKLI